MHDLSLLIREHMEKAQVDPHGRSAHMLIHEGPLRQTIIALTAGTRLDDHEAPSAATLQVLYGDVRITTADGGESERCGSLCVIPQERHGLVARDDSVVLLTTVVA